MAVRGFELSLKGRIWTVRSRCSTVENGKYRLGVGLGVDCLSGKVGHICELVGIRGPGCPGA